VILLDTHLIAEALLPPDRDLVAQEWLDQQHPETLFLSEVSLTELKLGLRATSKLKSPKKALDTANQLAKELKGLFGTRILSFDEKAIAALAQVEASAEESRIHLSLTDSIIAATALAHGFKVATRDTNPFEAVGLKVINPWKM
jgi:predicted nucleic acid-binding protein